MNRYIIGIDTGGTFTDGVLLQYQTREVVSTAKTLTTKSDLKVGVINALKQLKLKDDFDVRMVGISSTLATNTIAEGKARRVALLLIGYDKELMDNYSLEAKLVTEKTVYFRGGHTSQGREKQPLDETALKKWLKKNKAQFDAIALSGYFSPLNPEHEEKAFEIIKKNTNLPVVMGHQLSTRLDSVKRAATASINASLVAVMSDFIEAVQVSMKNIGVLAPLMIVRGDGTLMPCDEAIQKPVETVLSGPAASAIGGRFLSRKGNSLVIDVGSTTTDMALVEDSRVVITQEGARVGETETAIEAAKIRTVSIGCDSHITLDKYNKVVVGPDRVTPVCQMAERYKSVADELEGLKNRGYEKIYLTDIEYWLLYRPIEKERYETLTDLQKKVLEMIQEGPVNLTKIFKSLKLFHPAQLKVDELIKQGYIEMATLTPTDLLHAGGDLQLWDSRASKNALEHFCKIPNISSRKFIDITIDKIVSIIVEEVFIYLACQNLKKSKMPSKVDGAWGKWVMNEIFEEKNDYLTVRIDSKVPIIGTGAPADFFLKRTARHLNAHFILPEYYEVANAVGAVSGFIMETKEAIVIKQENLEKRTFIVQFAKQKKNFDDYDEACEYAIKNVKDLARQEAVKSGADDPFVEVKSSVEGTLKRYVARAIGNPKLSEKQIV